MKILCTADVHIGRRSSRLPPLVDSHTHSAAEAWTRIVDLAIAEVVDLVTISGDLIDQANRYFEAVGTLERGLERLAAAEIVTLMVAGNHDHDVLPLVAADFAPDFVKLLGRGGEWERVTIERRGARVHVDGWSFPRARQMSSPLATYRPLVDGTPTLALLHADLDQPGSPYAPVGLGELRRHAGTIFLLGHVHAARQVNEVGGARLLYPGSPQALDPGETGLHGALVLDLRPDGVVDPRIVPVSTIRYESVEVSIDGLERPEELDANLRQAVARTLEDRKGTHESLRHLRCRVRLTGATHLHRSLDGRLLERTSDLDLERGDARASVESIEIATKPERDLDAVARGVGSAAVLARLVQDLEREAADSAGEKLLRDATLAAREMERATPYLEILDAERPEDDRRGEVRQKLLRAATVLLDELLAQKEPAA